MNTLLKTQIADFLRNNNNDCPYYVNNDGLVCIDWEFVMSAQIVTLAKENSLDEFKCQMECEANEMVLIYYFEELFTLVENEFTTHSEDDLREALWDIISIDTNIDRLLAEKLPTTIMVNAYGVESNTDFSENTQWEIEPDPRSGIAWLAATQGYSTSAVATACAAENSEDVESKFLRSLKEEVEETCSGMVAVTALINMSLEDIAKANESMRKNKTTPDGGTIQIPQKATVGLYNPWSGAASMFGVELEKPITLHARDMFTVLPDKWLKEIDGHYSVDETCGMCSSAWRGVGKYISNPLLAAS